MENPTKVYSVPAAIIGVALVLGTVVIAHSLYRVKALANSISVTGSADRIVTSDIAKWSTSFNHTVEPTALKTGTAAMKADLEKVRSYLLKNGVAESEITVQPLTMAQLCDSNNNVVYDRMGNQGCNATGVRQYNLQQTVIIETNKIDSVKKMSQDAPDTLIGQGVTFTTQGIEYYYSKLSELRVQLLAEATKDAQNRATRIAESTGSHLGKLQSASMGVIQVTAQNSVDFSDYGSYDTAAIQKKVTAVVRAGFVVN